jgi:hypothetical protein
MSSRETVWIFGSGRGTLIGGLCPAAPTAGRGPKFFCPGSAGGACSTGTIFFFAFVCVCADICSGVHNIAIDAKQTAINGNLITLVINLELLIYFFIMDYIFSQAPVYRLNHLFHRSVVSVVRHHQHGV